MPDDGAAVLDAPETAVNSESAVEESSKSTVDAIDGKPVDKQTPDQDRIDGRKKPDATRKFIADLRRAAESETDPTIKAEKLARAKELSDGIGKLKDGYESVYPTVREVREVKAALDSITAETGAKDWREGISQMQTTLSNVAAIDAQLSAGDASVIEKLWQEAPEGMPKLVAPIVDRFAKEKPEEYGKFIAPRAIAHLDQSGFPQAFDRMAQLYEQGKTEEAKALKLELIQWVTGQRKAAAEAPKQADPEVEKLRAKVAEGEKAKETAAVNTAYSAILSHAGPVIDKVLKPMIAKLGLSPEQYSDLQEAVWSRIETSRNADPTYKVVGPAKAKQGYNVWTEYAKGWTDQNAEEAARQMVKLRYGHQLKNGAQQTAVNATRQPGAVSVQQGKEPAPSEIDYGPRGAQAARKAGFKDLQDMLLSGQAPMKTGGIRKWR
jgi:hypothetical protein